MAGNIITALIALLFSALFSGYEMAFLHCNRLKVALDKKEGRKYAIVMDRFIQNEGDLISTLLMGNNIFNVVFSIAIATLLDPIITTHITDSLTLCLLIETVIATIIVLVTGEFLPKAVSLLNPNGVFSSLYGIIIFFYYILYPLTYITNAIANLLMKGSGFKKKINSPIQDNSFDETDLMDLSEQMEDAQNQEGMASSDMEIFQNAIDFSTTKIKECLIPRTEITAIDIEDSVNDLLKLFVDTGYSRIPVYEDTVDTIIGYVLSKDVLLKKADSIREFLRPIKYVDMDMDAQTLLEVMTKRKDNIVAVRDEYGGTEGIITLEDLIEEIFGNIDDELDTNNFVEKKISDSEYVFSARLEVKELNKKYELDLPEDDSYETLAGLILNVSGSIPKEKESIEISDNTVITILKTSKRRIETVSLKLN
ncbi:MAG: hemolysin family protein [Candidatus Egerieousia sp.]